MLIANEVVEDIRKSHKRGMVFKVDFKKAYNNIEWDFLVDTMKEMGFGSKWCNWIQTYLNSSSVSVLVNGSLTKEFKMKRGVRQGDPLAPFLFLLVAEGLNALVLAAKDKGLFEGVKVGKEEIRFHTYNMPMM